MLKIYGRANSSNVRKVLWVADEIGLPYTREDWGRGFRSTDEPEFKRLSAFGVVPVVDDDNFILRESNTITRYLCAKHKCTDLYPTELQARALVEMWMDWGSFDLYLGVRPVFLGLVVKSPAFQDSKLIEDGIADWTRQMRRLDAQLAAHGPYLAGAALTLADIPAGIVVNRWFSIPFAKPALPAVAAYYERLAERAPYRTHVRNGTP
jgi:glutathione S-transferase